MTWPKIPHPWWHWFFTDLAGWSVYNEYVDYRCYKCKKDYRLKPTEAEYEKVVVK